MIDALDIWVKGVVQGVGFRPFVYKMAKKYLINGWVMNGVDGVHIHAEGESDLLDEFVLELSEHHPAAAQVTEIEMHEVPLEPFDTFEIRTSDDAAVERPTLVSPDLATCSDCERELFDENDRRYRYPFINCTNCGPRFTIIDTLPYDRANTSMREFAMCDTCQHEYDDPTDRRFHAQPNSCSVCGPVLTFYEGDAGQKEGEGKGALGGGAPDEGAPTIAGSTRECTDAIFARAVDMLMAGSILAVKGLGGFHLVCDANNEEAVAKLRERKHRDGKPFAVMMASLLDVHKVCHVSNEEAALLQGAVRPIVLLRKRAQARFVAGLADKLPELGVMLPYTPVQHILFHDFAQAVAQASAQHHPDMPPMLVMTSGNVHDEPIVIDDDRAREELGGIADAFIGNNRTIVTRFDDSVLRIIRTGAETDAVQFLRRARGYAPSPLVLTFRDEGGQEEGQTNAGVSSSSDARAHTCVFGTGPEQKNTFAFVRNTLRSEEKASQDSCISSPVEAFVAQHIGDMENAETFDAWLETKERYQQLFDLHPNAIACDLHPEYLTSKWAEERSLEAVPPIPLTKVQHHFAHIVSALAENGISHASCGIAFDGTGYGVDGNIWGGEVLISNLHDYERFINFAYVPMPGGQAAIKNPLRIAYGVLWEFDLLEHPGASHVLTSLGEDQVQMCDQMIEQGINTPVTSSVGRLFDAASAMLGVCDAPTYEGEAAILLEAALWEDPDILTADTGKPYVIDVLKNTATETSTAHDTSVFLFDAAPAFKALLDDKVAGVSHSIIAKRFHDAFVTAIVQAVQLADAMYGIKTVALSGGVFMNRYLIEHAIALLSDSGFTVAINRELPPNDGCISLGEAVVGLFVHKQ